MWWYVLQVLVMFAVGSHAIYYEWNQNGYAVAIVAGGAAFGVTWLINWLLLKFPRKQQGPY